MRKLQKESVLSRAPPVRPIGLRVAWAEPKAMPGSDVTRKQGRPHSPREPGRPQRARSPLPGVRQRLTIHCVLNNVVCV
jgi:hypothetical protein